MTATRSRKNVKTISAENLRLRVPFAYYGTEKYPYEHPVHATAYHRDEGLWIVALTTGEHQEVHGSERILVNYEPESVKDLVMPRWCHVCQYAREHGAHLRRVHADRAATVVCDLRIAEYKEERKIREAQEAQRKQEQSNRIDYVMDVHEKSRKRLVASVLRNVVLSHDYAHEEKRWARFDEVCHLYRLSREQGVALVEATYPEVTVEAQQVS